MIYRPTLTAAVEDESTDGSLDSSNSPPEVNYDMDMDEDIVSIADSQSPPSPARDTPRPAKLAPSPYRGGLSIEGRVPTPIHSAFNVPGITRPSNESVNMDIAEDSFASARHSMAPPPRRFAIREHPMPSPIRESMLSPRDAMLSPTQSGCMETSMVAATQMSRLSMSAGENMDVEEERTENLSRAPANVFTLGSPNRGRKRSGALLAEKKRFAIGYRDDCEKCRNRVPGHFSHFLPINE